MGDKVLVNGKIKTNTFCRGLQGQNDFKDMVANNEKGTIVDISPSGLLYCVEFDIQKINKIIVTLFLYIIYYYKFFS